MPVCYLKGVHKIVHNGEVFVYRRLLYLRYHATIADGKSNQDSTLKVI